MINSGYGDPGNEAAAEPKKLSMQDPHQEMGGGDPHQEMLQCVLKVFLQDLQRAP